MNKFERHTNVKEAIGIGIKNAERSFHTRIEAAEWIHKNIRALYPGMEFTRYVNVKYLPTIISIDLTEYIKKKITIKGKKWDEVKIFNQSPISKIPTSQGLSFKWSPGKIVDYVEDIENDREWINSKSFAIQNK